MIKYIEYLKIDEDLKFPINSVYDDMGSEIISTEIKGNNCYIVNVEDVGGKKDKTTMDVAYNLDGVYIGDEKTAKMLCGKGIKPEPIDKSHKICSIGFNEKEQKWYGWSHRAIYGFGIGSKVKKGDVAFLPKNKKEFLESLKDWYSDDMYENLEFKQLKTGIKISYCITPKKINENLFGGLGEMSYICKIKDLGYNRYQKTLNENDSKCSSTIERYPKKWGRGEWTAKTLDDAKAMAIDFANSVA